MSSSKEDETEIVIYAKVTKPAGLSESTTVETHEQLEGKFSKGQKCRTRKVTDSTGVNYFFTYKLKSDKHDDVVSANQEFTTSVDKAFTDGFRGIADKLINKTRYVFNSESVKLTFKNENGEQTIDIPNIKYEVDVYVKPDGENSEWCKIDIEVDTILSFMEKNHPELKDVKMNIKISHLPFQPMYPILASNADEEQKKFIDQLWTSEFSTALNGE